MKPNTDSSERRAWMPRGFEKMLLASLGLHFLLVVIVVAMGTWARYQTPPRHAIATRLVSLGEKRPEKLLPRKKAPPPPPPAEEQAIVPPSETQPPPAAKAAVPLPAPKETPPPAANTQSAQERLKELTRVSSALDRLKTSEPPDGSPDGAVEGDAKHQEIGDKFVTEVHNCLKANYAFEGLDPRQVAGKSAAVIIRVQQDGTFMDHRLVKSSGLPAFDRAVVRAVKRCGRVSPPHAAIRSDVQSEGILIDFTP